MGKSQPVRDALGLGEKITFADGTQLTCVPACLADLEEAMALWHKCLGHGMSILLIYSPGQTEAKEAFEELLYVACGRKIEKERLLKQIRMTDGGREVVAFIDRFLGFEPADPGAKENQE